jgi:hypothetical protein
VNLIFFQAGINGGLSGDLHLWATDPGKTGKFHLDDLSLAQGLFNASGDVEAGLTAYIKVGIEVLGKFIGYEKDFDIATAKLIDFGSASLTGNPYAPPPDLALASPDLNDPSILYLNLGQRSGDLTSDTALSGQKNVSFEVSHKSDNKSGGEVVEVLAFGFHQDFGMGQGIKKIVILGLDGNDMITIDKDVTSSADIAEGNGNDQIEYLGNGNAKIVAGNGNDLVIGGHGFNYVRTGSGNSTLEGGDGKTAAVPPTWGQAMTANGAFYVNDLATGSGFGANVLKGGTGSNYLVAAGFGTNKLTAGNADDYLEGDGGLDSFVAGSGHDTVSLSGGSNTVFWQVGDGNLDVRTNDILSNTNALDVSGSSGPDTFSLIPNGQFGGLDVEANSALIHWVGFIDRVSIDGGGGADTTNVADMESSWVTDIGLNDGEGLQPDGSADVMNIQGSPNYHTILVKTESAFLHPEGPIGGMMLVQTHPHYRVHTAVVNNEDTLNVYAKGSNNTINVQSNTGHTVIHGDAGSDTFNVSSDAPTDTGVLLDPPPQQQRPPFGLFGTLDLRAGPGFNRLVVSEAGSTQPDHVIVADGSINGGPLHSINPITKLPVTMKWQVNYDTPPNGSFGAGIVVATGSAADSVQVQRTAAGVPVTVRTGGGGDQITVGDPGGTLDSINGGLLIDGGDGKAVLTFDDRNTPVPAQYQLEAAFLRFRPLLPLIQFAKVGTIVLDAAPRAVVGVRGVAAATNALINLAGTANEVIVGSALQQLLGAIQGTVAVNGTGTDTVVIDDLNGPGMSAYSLTGHSVTDGPAVINYTHVKTVLLLGAHGPSQYLVQSVADSPILTIHAQGFGNSLQGPNQDTVWTITMPDAGKLGNSILFTGMGNLAGGTALDVFVFNPGASLSGKISGGGGSDDWLDYAAYTSPVAVNLIIGAATGVAGGVAGIRNVRGGQAGNVLRGNALGNILIGGAGPNVLIGGTGRSILIGGKGKDTVTGHSGSDILVAGYTDYDSSSLVNDEALDLILAEWQSGDPYQLRINLIKLGGPINGKNLLVWGPGGTVHDNALSNLNTLTGGGLIKQNWFFENPLHTQSNRGNQQLN